MSRISLLSGTLFFYLIIPFHPFYKRNVVFKKVIEFFACGKKGEVLRLGHSYVSAVISVSAILNRKIENPLFQRVSIFPYQFYVEYFVHELSCRLPLQAGHL